jgi:hypothetical protein
VTTTHETRQEANALLVQAEKALDEGNIESFDAMITDAQAKMAQADSIDQAASQLKTLKGEFNRPVNAVPIADKDVALYNPNDTTATTKASYKPSSWVRDLPAMAQPLWVQEQMGKTEKEHAQFQTDTFMKWMRSPRDDVFWKTANADEVKAMEEGYMTREFQVPSFGPSARLSESRPKMAMSRRWVQPPGRLSQRKPITPTRPQPWVRWRSASKSLAVW